MSILAKIRERRAQRESTRRLSTGKTTFNEERARIGEPPLAGAPVGWWVGATGCDECLPSIVLGPVDRQEWVCPNGHRWKYWSKDAENALAAPYDQGDWSGSEYMVDLIRAEIAAQLPAVLDGLVAQLAPLVKAKLEKA